jgi:hypothetical protein
MSFKALKESDLDLLRKYLPQYGNGDCDLSLVSLFSRGIHKHFRFFEYVETHLVFERLLDKDSLPVFVMPIGEAEIPQSLFNHLEQIAKNNAHPLRFYGRTDMMAPVLSQAFPGRKLVIEENPNRWDYVYSCSDFVELPGSHFHSKRNFVKRFYKACPEAQFDVYTKDLFNDCMSFLTEWYSGREMNDGLIEEKAAIEKVLQHWDELPVYGGILHERGRILGLTYGARSASDILSVHIEKATREIPGAYPALSQAFAQSLPLCIEYLNREEDLGIPGLRKAKQDWHPITQLKKGTIEIR